MESLSEVILSSQTLGRREALRIIAGSSLCFPAILTGQSLNSRELRVGLIGSGGRGTGATSQALRVNPNIRLVAMADIAGDRLESSRAALKGRLGTQVDVPDSRAFVGLDAYEKVLQSEVDLVIIASPPGFHPLHFQKAVSAGKHVFLEKPVAVDVAGSLAVLETAKLARQKGLSCLVGYNRRFQKCYIEAITKLPELLGSVKSMNVAWQGAGTWVRDRKPGDSEMRYQLTNWMHFTWLSGDHFVEQHSHNLDIVQWVMGRAPLAAKGFVARETKRGPEMGDACDNYEVQFTYPNGVKVVSFARQQKSMPNRVDEIVEGENGARITLSNAGKITAEKNGQNVWLYNSRRSSQDSDPDPYQEEHRILIESIYKGQAFNNVQECTESTLMAIMGRTAAYEEREVKWDELLASGQRFFPAAGVTSFEERPPTVPDKFGDYPVPARPIS